MDKTTVICVGLIAVGLTLIAIGSASAYPFTVPELVALGLVDASSVMYGTVSIPVGFTQIDGGLFDTSEQAETGLFRGVAYEFVDTRETGLFVGGGY